MSDEPPQALDYASPTTPRRPFRLRSRHVAYVTGPFAVFAALFIPDTVGSGVVRVNPFAALACFAVMGGAIVYVWTRLFEEGTRPPRLAAFVGTCATIAMLALPLQFWTLANDYGDPRPWVRLKALLSRYHRAHGPRAGGDRPRASRASLCEQWLAPARR